MMKRFKFFTLAAMLVLPLAACDEGDDTVTPTVAGSVTGAVTIDNTGVAGVTVQLSSGASATTNAAGQYTFANVPSGAYTVTISGAPLAGAAFPATTLPAVIASAGQVVTVNFAGSRIRTASIIGSVTTTGGAGLGGVTVTVTGPESRTATTGTGATLGQYSVTGLAAGTYTVAISTIPAGNQCATTSQSVVVGAGEARVASFTCTQTTGAAGSISGRPVPGPGWGQHRRSGRARVGTHGCSDPARGADGGPP